MDNYTYEYLPLRGITKETLKFFDVLTKIDGNGKPVSLGFRYPNGSYKVRWLDKKDFYTVGTIGSGKAGLFGRDRFSAGSHKYVTITEGEFDALSLYQTLGSPCVSVFSSGSAVADCTADRSWLNQHERIYLAFDNDERGREATAAVAKLFDYGKIFHVKFTKYKDANDYLQFGEREELRNIWWNAKKYQPEDIKSTLAEFASALEGEPKQGIPYPFPTLNTMTYGIRTGETVVIKALEGVGKTEIMHAIEYSILKETDHAVGAIFIEEPEKRHLEAIAGQELRAPVHLPNSGYSRDRVIRAVTDVVRVDDRLYIYDHFGSDDPGHILEIIRYLVCACGVRVIMLDHIGLCVPALAGETERQALEYLSASLVMMAKQLDFALLMVSHVNDEGLTRGTRMISKNAHVVIEVRRDLMAATEEDQSKTYLYLAKNRPASKTGPAGVYQYNLRTCQWTEVAANDNARQYDQINNKKAFAA